MPELTRTLSNQSNSPVKEPSKSRIIRRDINTGRLQMVEAKKDTAEDLDRESRSYGSNGFRVNRYFESAFSKPEKEFEYQYKCDYCRDYHTVIESMDTPGGAYDFAFQCGCQSGKDCGCGCGGLKNVRAIG